MKHKHECTRYEYNEWIFNGSHVTHATNVDVCWIHMEPTRIILMMNEGERQKRSHSTPHLKYGIVFTAGLPLAFISMIVWFLVFFFLPRYWIKFWNAFVIRVPCNFFLMFFFFIFHYYSCFGVYVWLARPSIVETRIARAA